MGLGSTPEPALRMLIVLSLRLSCVHRETCLKGTKNKKVTQNHSAVEVVEYICNPNSLDAEAGGFLGFPKVWPIDETQDQIQN